MIRNVARGDFLKFRVEYGWSVQDTGRQDPLKPEGEHAKLIFSVINRLICSPHLISVGVNSWCIRRLRADC